MGIFMVHISVNNDFVHKTLVEPFIFLDKVGVLFCITAIMLIGFFVRKEK